LLAQKQTNFWRLVAGQWGENRIKPNRVKAIVMKEMTQEWSDQTHGEHLLII